MRSRSPQSSVAIQEGPLHTPVVPAGPHPVAFVNSQVQPGISYRILLLSLCSWLVPPGGAAQLATAGTPAAAPFSNEADAPVLEGRAADLRSESRLALRWRLQTDSATYGRSRLYQRLDWQLGEGRGIYFLAEKDPGERRWDDFTSFHLRWRSSALPLDLVAGDLKPGFGQGLLFGRYASRGGVPTAAARRESQRIGYRSSSENGALRGVALRYNGRGSEAVGLLAVASLDARFDEDGVVTTLPESGIHISERELAGRDGMKIRVFGLRLRRHRAGGLGWGVTLQQLAFNRPLDLRRPGKVATAFRGRRQLTVAADGVLTRGLLQSFGEVARHDGNKWAGVGGVRFDLPGIRLSGLGRYYAPGFQSFFGGAASGAGSMSNEVGFQLSIAGRRGGLRWRLYADQFRRLQPASTDPLPAAAETWGLELERRPRRGSWYWKVAVQGKLRGRWRGGNPFGESSQRLRTELLKGTGSNQLRLRAELKRLEGEGGGELGALVSARVARSLAGRTGILHLSRFRTDSYITRIYEYEQSLPGSVSLPPLYGDGWRIYALLRPHLGATRLALRYRREGREGQSPRHRVGVQIDL
ncbi:MAG: hypothetical protein CME15_06280 [Gemmatimonadetes bacterium]|nr:hypothetical protein [Gemmatimonadota bacterium]